MYDSDASTNVIKKGDNIYMAFDEQVYVNQNLASQAIGINPFSVVVHEGTIQLSPSSDEWRDTKRAAPKVVDGGTRLNTKQAFMWNNWQWNWGGTPIEKLKVGSTTNTRSTSNSSQNITNVNKVVGEETVRKVVADRVIDVAVIPFIRSRKIFFKAQGLRPNSKVFAFFDGKPVADWVRSETFQFHSDNATDYGNLYQNATSHPDGSGTLQTDANGEISGSFFIPNSSTLKFRTGTRQFKLLDISVDKEDDALAVARAPYTASGYLDTYQKEFLSTRVLTVEGVKTVTNRRAAYQNRDDGDGPQGKAHLYVGGGTFSRDPQRVAHHRYGTNAEARLGQALLDKADNPDTGGGKIVCTEMYRQTQLEDWKEAIKIWGVHQKKYLTPYHEVGYHWLFKPWVRGMRKSVVLTSVGAYLAKARTQHLKHILTHGKAKDDIVGNIWCKIVHPLTYVAGRIKMRNSGKAEG